MGATRQLDTTGLAERYDLDRRDFLLGTGRRLYERASESLELWRHFEIPWLGFYSGGSRVHEDQVVATLASVAGVWFLNPCKVVYAELQGPEHVAFAYGTLEGHAEAGEERFQVSYDAATEEVRYQIVAFSRPALVLSRLGYFWARRLQKRFAEESFEALARAAV